jgi:Glycosyl hydrolase family 14
MQQNLRHAAKLRGHAIWGRGPDNAGYYNSRPHETGFFCDKGDYDNYYGRFFLKWYTGYLINHTDQVLSLTRLAFDGIQVVIKVIPILNSRYFFFGTLLIFLGFLEFPSCIMSQRCRNRTLMPATSIQFSVILYMTCNQHYAAQAKYQNANCDTCYPIPKVNRYLLFILFLVSIAILVV